MEEKQLPKEEEPEIIVENFENPPEKQSQGFFSELANDADSYKKIFYIGAGVLVVAIITVFTINAFMQQPSSGGKKAADLSKITSQSNQNNQQGTVAPPQVMGPQEGTNAQTPADASSPTPSIPITTPTTEPTPTKKPDPTSTPNPTATPVPTAAPTAIPPTATPSPTEAPTPT